MIIPGDILELILSIQVQKSAHVHIEYDDCAKASWSKEKSICSIAVFRVRPEHPIYLAWFPDPAMLRVTSLLTSVRELGDQATYLFCV